ncbi:MAG: hypothetical protein WAW09_06775 [Smithella sp.]
MLEVLGKNTMSAYDIAAKMTWDIDCKTGSNSPSLKNGLPSAKLSLTCAIWKVKDGSEETLRGKLLPSQHNKKHSVMISHTRSAHFFSFL